MAAASKTEIEEACRVVRERVPGGDYVAALLESQQATIERLTEIEGVVARKKVLIAGLVDAALAANKERDLLRAVVRCADYFIVPGMDSRYDEARKALVEFDKGKR